MKTISREQGSQHYQWGNQCAGWNLVDEETLSIKLESMPPETSERRHFHHHAQQFFFILKGNATFEIENEVLVVTANEGILIKPSQKHKISNAGTSTLEFILVSQPSTVNDRVNLNE
jgi:mannose-6-phosphate isomerase-like protein (cupin superfamily)